MRSFLKITLKTFFLLTAVQGFLFAEVKTGGKKDIEPDNNELRISAGSGLMYGNSAYQIGGSFNSIAGGGKVRFPISELIFPVEYVPYLYFHLSYHSLGFIKIVTDFKYNLSPDSGTFYDRDWGVFYYKGISGTNENTLDVYSESTARVKFIYTSLKILFENYLTPRASVFYGPGFYYHWNNFTISNVHQSYPSCARYGICSLYPDIIIDGNVLLYEEHTFAPMAFFGFYYKLAGFLHLYLEGGISPYLIVADVDDHLLRSKRSDGKAVGTGVRAMAELIFRLSGFVDISLDFQYAYYAARGKQRQVFYQTTTEATKGDWFEIENKVSQSYASVNLNIHTKINWKN